MALGWAMWKTYMETPWTRDGVVRTYVVTMAPEVAGRIVELPVLDNEFVHKGDLLLVIDPTDYKVAVQLSEAAVRQAPGTSRRGVRRGSDRGAASAGRRKSSSGGERASGADIRATASGAVPRFGREGGGDRTNGAANGIQPGRRKRL
jgi:multidrug resistance efflux pump